MTGIGIAKKVGISILVLLLIALAISFFPSGSDSEKAIAAEKTILLSQLQELNSLPPAIDVKIEPAVKEDVKEALYLAAAAKSPEEAAEKRKVEVLVKASSKDAGKGIEKLDGVILNEVDSVDKSAKYFAVKVDAGKIAEIAADGGVDGISQRGVVYPMLDSSVPVIKADAFWNAGYKGNSIRVAVLDTGVDDKHPMLKGKVAAGKDFTNSGNADDECGHGTHVAGIVAGTKANGGLYDGVAPDAQLLSAKVITLNSNGECEGKVDYIIAAIGWALDPDKNPATNDGAKVISMSLGGKGKTSDELENNIKTAVANGAVVVVSSGNCGSGCPSFTCGSFRGVTWPGNSPSVITVGAIDDSKNVACFSSGENIAGVGIKPDFAAPGVDVKSSVPGGGYQSLKGTSMAAPHVSGAVALMLSRNPSMKQDDVRRVLEKTALDRGEIGKDTSYGFGLIDMAKALNYKEGLEFNVEMEQQIISGAIQKVKVTVYDDVTVNSVKATITKPNTAKSDITLAGSGNSYSYDYTDTALLGNYIIDVAVNYGGGGGSSGAGSEGGGEAGGGAGGSSSVTATGTAYFKVTSLTGDFGSVEEINVSKEQFLSRNLTANITFANTAAVELTVSMLLQLLDNGTLAQEIRPAATTAAANSKVSVIANNALAVNPGNYTLRILTDYGAGSIVNETNITVVDDLAPQILKVDYSKAVKVNDAQVITVEVNEHQKVAVAMELSQITGTGKCDGTAGVIMSDDFNDNDLNYSKWETNEWSSGKLLESDGNLYFETGSASDQQARTRANIGSYDNFTLTLRMKIDYVSPDKNQGFWLGNLAEGQPNENSKHRGYYWQFHGKTRGFNIGARYDDKSAGLHGKDGPPNWEPGKWHDLKVERAGGVARFYFDGALVGTDSAFAPLLNELYWNTGRTWRDPREDEGAKIHVDDFSVVTTGTGCSDAGGAAFIKPITANYTARLVSEVGNKKTIAVTIFNGSDNSGANALREGSGYVATLQLCDASGNCEGKLGSGKKDAEFNITGCNGKGVLVVKTYDSASVFEEAAAANSNICLSSLNKSISGTPPTSYLERFDTVVWTTGTDLVNIDGNDAAALTDYYGKKGRVVVEGSDVAFRHGSDSFMRDVLHSELKTDLGFTVASVANMINLGINVTRPHPVVAGLAAPAFFNATLDPFPDAVQPYNGGVELAAWSGLDTKGSAIVAYESVDGKSKSLLLPFSIVALNGSDARAVSAGALKWLLEEAQLDIKVEGVNSTIPAVDGQQFTWAASIGASEPLKEPPKVKVIFDNSVVVDAVPSGATSQPLGILNVAYAEIMLNSTPQAFVARLNGQVGAADVKVTLVLTGPCQAQVCIMVYPLPLKPNYTTEIISEDGKIKELGVIINPPLKAGKGYMATLAFCDKENRCVSTKELPFEVLDGKGVGSCKFFKAPNAKDWLNCHENNGGKVVTIKYGADAINIQDAQQPQLYTYSFSAALPAGRHSARIVANSDFSLRESGYVNNVRDFAFTVYPKLPDLTLTGFAYNYNKELKNVKTALTASNIGGTAAKATVEAELKPEGRIIFDDKMPRCGGIAGLKCAEKLQCLYSDGGTRSTYPDELGWCASETDSKWFAPKKQKVDVELAPGEAKYLTFTFELPQCMIEPWLCGWKLPPAYNFTAVIDPEGKVEEHNESNNKLSERIYLCSKERVLVVDDNDAAFFSTPEPGSSGEFVDVLRNAGFCVDVWDVKQQGAPGSSDLSGFKAVVWSAGDYFNGTISNDDAISIGNYSGGLLLEGSDIGLDSSESGLLQSIASAAFSSDMLLNESKNETLLLKQHEITANITNISISKEKSPYPDAVDAVGGEVVAEWQSGKAAITAIASSGGSGSRKTAYYAFSVDGITDAAAMEALVTNTVEWLLEKPNNAPLLKDVTELGSGSVGDFAAAAVKVTMKEGQTKNFSVLATDPDGDPLTFKWLLNGTVVSTIQNFTFSPKYNESGTYNLTIIVSDGQAETRAEFTLIVLDVLDCGAGMTQLCPLQLGVCKGSNVTCDSKGKWPGCTAATYLSYSDKYEVNEKSCDSLDNDCNGKVDEGFGDVDDDKISDCVDDDNDNDGTKDDEDDLIGNETSINFTGDDKNVKIGIEEDKDDKGDDKGRKTKTVRINNSGKPLIEFDFNFSKGNILLRNLSIEKQNKSGEKGFTLVRGLDLKGKKKQMYVDRLVNGSNSVCVKDSEVSAVSQVSGSCSGANETVLVCNFPKAGQPYAVPCGASGGSGNSGGNIGNSGGGGSGSSSSSGGGGAGNNGNNKCDPLLFCQFRKETSQFLIYGLKHSAVLEQCTDADLDTYLPVGCSGGTDCNDNNSSISPAAAEACNGVDDNCNGQVDENRVCNTAPVLQSVGNKTVSENGVLSFAVAATDSENDALAYNATNLAAGASFDNATAAFAWTPSFTQAGTYAVTFNVSDGLAYDYETINVTVANTNRAPVFETVGNKTVLENSALSFTVSVTDPDGGSLAQLFVNVPEKLANAQFSSSTKEFKWAPMFDDSGSYAIWFTASDGQLSTNEFVNITVTNVNRPPRFENLTNQTVFENSTLQFFMNATDPDGQALEVVAREIPAGSVFTGNVFSWKPTFDDAGGHSYETVFELSDGQDSVRASVNITVLNVNRLPVISGVSGNLTVNETEAVTVIISATDADGDSLAYAVNNSVFSQPTPGRFEWATGFSSSGTYTILATASDGSATAQFAFTATVKNVNRVPRFENVTNQTVMESSTLKFFVNATDPDNGQLLLGAEMPSKLGSAKFDANAMTFEWTPTFNDAGSYTVLFDATDGQYSASAKVNVTVLNVNVAPAITNIHGSLTVNETENVTLLINASDHDGDAMAYSVNDSRFAQDISTGNMFRWKTGYEDAGAYVVLASASDGSLTTTAAVTVKVDNVNRAPVLAAIGNKTVNENSALRFKVAASDPDSDAVSITVARPQAAEGLAFDSSASEVVWTPTFEQAGSYALAITASDSNLTDSEQVNISVLNVNRAPVIQLVLVEPPGLEMGEGETKSFTAGVGDDDNDEVSVVWKVNSEVASTEPLFEFAPEYNGSGTYAIELSVSDSETTTTTSMTLTVQDTLDCSTGQTKLCPLQLGICASSFETCASPGKWLGCGSANYGSGYVVEEKFCSLQDNVNSCKYLCDGKDNDCNGKVDEERVCNTAPVMQPLGNRTVKENETLQFTLAAADAESDALTFASSLLQEGAVLDSGSGAFSWTPTFSQAGSYAIAFTVTDGLQSDSKAVNITVENVNRAPVVKILLEPAGQAGYYVNEGELKMLKADASDPDGDSLKYGWWYLGNANWWEQGKSKLISISSFAYFFPNLTDGDSYNVHKFLLNVSDGNLTVNATEFVVVNDVQGCKPKSVETAACGSSVGSCKQGQMSRTCGSGFKWSEWSSCTGEVKPAAKDDCGTFDDEDCDGVVNNGCQESPDLAPEWMSWKLYDYASGQISASSLDNASHTMRSYLYGEVVNLGTDDSPPAMAAWYINGRLMMRTILPRINSSQKAPVAAYMPYAPYEGVNNISLIVDANSKIKEENEGNNQMDFPITVKYNETYKAWAKQYGEDYYSKLPTQEQCEKQGKCWG